MNFRYILILFIAYSCDHLYDYSYQVTNYTESEIRIELSSYRLDTVFSIKPGESKVLLITDHGIEGSKGPYFKDVLFELKFFQVLKGDTLSSKDYLLNSSWNYNNGAYTSAVMEYEFN